MNATGTGRPEFRLRFGYPELVVEEDGAAPRVVELDAADAAEALGAVGADIRRRRGRLTAILPEHEVWRGRAPDREAAARAAGRALGASGRTLALRLGPRGADGLRPAAAVSRATLRAARGFLARAGIRPARVTGGGAFPGFGAAPDFGGGLPALPGGGATATTGVAATLALLAWLGPWASEQAPADAVALAPVAEAGAGTVVAEAPEVEALTPPAAVAPAAKPAAPVRTATLRAAPPRARPLALAAPPPERTYAVIPSDASLGPATIATRGMPPDLSATRQAPRPGAPLVDVAPPPARPSAIAPAPAAAAAVPAAVSATPAAAGAPLPRPRAEAAVAAPVRTAALVEGGPAPRPAAAPRRSAVESLVASLDAAIATPAEAATPEAAFAAAASVTPRARPDALALAIPTRKAPEPKGVQVASLAPLAETPGLASILTPEPRRIAATPMPAPQPVVRATPRPEPVRASVAPQPKAQAAPVRASVAAQPVVRAQPAVRTQPVITAQPARAQPQRVQTAALQPAPQPARTTTRYAQPSAPKAHAATPRTNRAVSPAPQPARKQTVRAAIPTVPAKGVAQRPQPAKQTVRAQRRQEPAVNSSKLALVGIFGGAGGKHALIQLPNGDTQRVKAGDTVKGVQVVAIAADGVQLRSRGRDSVLRLPD